MLPPVYIDSSVRNITPVCMARGRLGIGFDLDAGPQVRLSITPESAKFLRDEIDLYISSLAGSQSSTSELMPSEPKSVPSDGVNVWPPATSSTAPVKLW
jgi:hypothetical protein